MVFISCESSSDDSENQIQNQSENQGENQSENQNGENQNDGQENQQGENQQGQFGEVVLETEEIPCDNYREAMRDFVKLIALNARKTNPTFVIIPQNGQGVAWDDEDEGEPDSEYLSVIDGTGREDTFYGTDSDWSIADGVLTPEDTSEWFQEQCDVFKNAGVTVLSTDYTTDNSTKINDSFAKNAAKGYISFAAVDRNLTKIPSYSVYNENSSDVTKLSDAKNFLYLIDPEKYSTKASFVNALAATNYDVFIIDLFCANEMLTASDLAKLKVKKNGGKRLVICYMSIGEAEDYRAYWKSEWNTEKPLFLCDENPEWKGNYKVRYWYPSWQQTMAGESGSYLSMIVTAGFDGVYLDIIDAYETFEEQENQ